MCRLPGVVALFVFLSGSLIHAQRNQPEVPFNRPELRPDFIYRTLDTDRDGTLSETEIEKVTEFLWTLDRDQNGVLSSDELVPDFPPFGPGGPNERRGGGMGPNRPELKLLEKHDKDGNGYLDVVERKLALKEVQAANANGRQRPGRGPRGGAREPGRPGPKVAPDQVEVYTDQALYDPTVLRTLFIQFDSDDWEAEMAALKFTDVEMPATVIVDGKTYPMAGISFRGQSSFSHVSAGLKRSLNLSMDLVDSDQRLYGYKTLNLLNCNGDSSMMSSALYSFVAQDFLPAPKANFVKVVINGESWGVYSNVQQFNKDFLKEHFRDSSGARWKVPGSPGADGGLRYLGDQLEDYKQRFEIKSKDKEQSWLALVNLCKVLNETPSSELSEAIEPILNVDGLLRFLAMDVALVNSDGYWTRASDYNLFLDSGGVFHVIPHDMNEAFVTRGPRGRRPGGDGPGFGPPPGLGPPPGDRPRRGFDDDRPRELDEGRRNDFRGPDFRGPDFRGPDFRGPAERDDRRRGGFRGGRRGGRGGPGHGDATLDPLVSIEGDRMPLRSRILAVPAYRQKYLQYVRAIAEKKFDFEIIGPVIEGYRELLFDEVKADTRKLTSFDAFDAMSSREANQDGSPRPSLYTFLKDRREFLLNHDEIKQVGRLEIEPGRFATPVVTSNGPKPSIAISELLASNKNSNKDPQGDHEDWIELVNYGEDRVDLSGMYLSDDPTNLFKWRIPNGTILDAGQYLVIWADEDGGDSGLHANFKLSSKGESVSLVSGETLVDKVEFGVQKTDVSFGVLDVSSEARFELTPTPGKPNQRVK